MRKTALSFSAALLAGTMATPVLADASYFGEIDKTKDIVILEQITINKTVNIDVEADLDLANAAQAMALVNIRNRGNTVDRSPDPQNEDLVASSAEILRDASMTNSVLTNTGVWHVNQDAGDMVNQGNVVSFALAGNDDTFVNAESAVAQDNGVVTTVVVTPGEGGDPPSAEAAHVGGGDNVNSVDWGLGIFNDLPDATADDVRVELTASIAGSVNDNTGIVGVNQNVGNMNNQTNSLAVAAGLFGEDGQGDDEEGAVALAESVLGQATGGNEVSEANVTKTGTIGGSVQNNTGVTHVNQAAGNMGNQANVTSVGAAIANQNALNTATSTNLPTTN